MFYKVVRALCAVFLRLAFRFRVVGLENVPDGGGFIIAANHRSNWDPVMMRSAQSIAPVSPLPRSIGKAPSAVMILAKSAFFWKSSALAM